MNPDEKPFIGWMRETDGLWHYFWYPEISSGCGLYLITDSHLPPLESLILGGQVEIVRESRMCPRCQEVALDHAGSGAMTILLEEHRLSLARYKQAEEGLHQFLDHIGVPTSFDPSNHPGTLTVLGRLSWMAMNITGLMHRIKWHANPKNVGLPDPWEVTTIKALEAIRAYAFDPTDPCVNAGEMSWLERLQGAGGQAEAALYSLGKIEEKEIHVDRDGYPY